MAELSVKDINTINELIHEHSQIDAFCKDLLGNDAQAHVTLYSNQYMTCTLAPSLRIKDLQLLSTYYQNQKTLIEQTLRRDYGVVL